LRGHDETIGERLVRDLAVFHDLPPAPYDACEKKAGRISSLSLVRYPIAYGHREVLIRGCVDEVVISCGAEVIGRHPRSYEREDFVFNPLRYLALLERKIGALDQAASLVGWDLPEEFATVRRLIEARMGKRGKREFVQILRLLEVFRPEDWQQGTGKTHIALGLGLAAFQNGLSVGFITAAALVHELIEARDEKRLLRLQRQLAAYKPLIIDELGCVPLSTTGHRATPTSLKQAFDKIETRLIASINQLALAA
jgi:hypothetical protein